MSKDNELTVLQKILNGHADVFGDLPEQDGGEVASGMESHGRAPAVYMPKLFVRAALTNFLKPQSLQNRNDFARLENGNAGHLRNFDGLNSNELRLNVRRAVLAQHFDDVPQVGIEFVEGGRLGMCAGKAGNVANIKSRVRATLDHCGIGFHERAPLSANATHSISSALRG